MRKISKFGSVWLRRGRTSGSILIFTLLTTVALLILGCAYLGFVERDNRFSGYQERSERAWFLAKSGLEYYRLYGCGEQSLSASAQPLDPPRVLLRVCVPPYCASQYFELADMGQGRLLCRGVEAGTLASSGQAVSVVRELVVNTQNLEETYDASLSF